MPNPTFHCKSCGKEVSYKDKTCSACNGDLTKGRQVKFNPFASFKSEDEISYSRSRVKQEILTHFESYKTNGVKDKSDVLYILGEVRKILERYKKSSDPKDNDTYERYRNLAFYCNWALHIEIDKQSRVTSLLREIDVHVGSFIKTYSDNDRIEIIKLLSNFISLQELRDLLYNFFLDYDISLLPINNTVEWVLGFCTHFIGLVIDSELRTEKDLENIDSIVVKRVKYTNETMVGPVEISIPHEEDLDGEPEFIVKFKNGDLFSVPAVPQKWLKK